MNLCSLGACAALLPSIAFAQQQTPVAAAWREFQADHGTEWRAEWNRATETPRAIYGPGLRLDEPIENLTSARTAAQGVLQQFGDLLGRGSSEFVETIGVRAKQVYIFVYAQRYRGLDVIGGRADVRIHDVGVLSMFGSSAVSIPADFNITPALTADAAEAIAGGRILGAAATNGAAAAPRLVIFTDTEGTAPSVATLAWEVQIDEPGNPPTIGKAYVDARGGALLKFVNEVVECRCGTTHVMRSARSSRHLARLDAVTRLAAATRLAIAARSAAPMALTGKVLAWTNLGLQPTSPMTNAPMRNLLVTSSVGNAYTDANGDFSIPYAGTTPIRVTATLTGRHSRRVRVSTGTQLVGFADINPGTPGTIQIGSPNQGELDRSQTTTYHFTDDSNVWLRTLLPGATSQLDRMSTMDPIVNIQNSCNAFYTRFTINFYNQGGSCNMTAFSTVIQHEWGHGLDDAFGGISQTDGLSEGWGDTIAIYRSGQPVVGSGFFKSSTQGIRDARNTRTYPVSGSVHTQGETWMGFNWDLRNNLIQSLGASSGASRAEQIVIASIAADATNQPAAVREVFLLDDDDGNLNNGTPNYLDLEKAAAKRQLPYPQRVNPNAGSYTTYGVGCAGSGAKPTDCLTVNSAGTPQTFGTRANLTYAIPATAPAAMSITGFELYSSGSQTVVTRVYSATSAGLPGSVLGTSSMTVGSASGWYKTTFASPIAVSSGQQFFVAFQNGSATIAASIRSGTDTPYFRNDGAGGAWNGPLNGFPWAYRVQCTGGAGAVPELTNAGVPELGQSFTVQLQRARPNSTGLLFLGTSDSSWGSFTLPLQLSSFGAPGCALLASGEFQLGFTADSVGAHARSFALPNDPSLFNFRFFNQFVITDSANPFGIVFSNAGSGKVGKQ